MFSIIIPCYKVAQWIRPCLDSVLAQGDADWEAICVDDGSTDDSGAILDEYAAKDSRFKVIHKQNEGVSIARNNVLARATGDYLGFVDADDVLGRDWLKAVADAISKTGADMVKMRFRRDFSFKEYHSPAAYRIYRGRDLFEWSALKGGLTVQNFYRRPVLNGVCFPVGMRVYEDGIFNLYALLNVKAGVQCEYDGYGYRFSETSAFKTRITEGEYARLVHECAKWFVVAQERGLDTDSLNVALGHIRDYVANRILEWVRSPKEGKGDPDVIFKAVSAAEKMMGKSIVPAGALRGVLYLCFYRFRGRCALWAWSSLLRLREHLLRAFVP